MRAVFDNTLQTDREKKCVRKHEGYYDAQSVYQKLNSFCIESTNARVSASTVLIYVTSAII